MMKNYCKNLQFREYLDGRCQNDLNYFLKLLCIVAEMSGVGEKMQALKEKYTYTERGQRQGGRHMGERV